MAIMQKNPRLQKLMRVYLLEHERLHGKPLFHAIVEQAKRLGLAGATVLRGICGFSKHTQVVSASIVDLSADLPLVIEIVDEEDRLNQLLPFIDQHLQDGLVTVEDVTVLRVFPPDRDSLAGGGRYAG
ncbi:MAG: DUF190 domain-containing protein [Negativicutes bacterium]|nr:DUF190 domain-containing protein [Negativicutes bacterium]